MKIIHLSDLHYPKFNKTEKLVNHIINNYSSITDKPIVIISGDLVDTNSRDSLDKVYNILEKLKIEGFDILICPGNHDLKWKGSLSRIKDKHREMFKNELIMLLPHNSPQNDLLNYPLINKFNNHYFIGLDSNKSGKRTAKGLIGNEQLSKLNSQINTIKKENKNAIIIVYLHHFPFFLPFIGRLWFGLRDRKKLIKTINGKINVLLFGHIHCTNRFEKREKKLNINCIHLSARTEDNSKPSLLMTKIFANCKKNTKNINSIRWTEIDTLDYSTKIIEYDF